MRYSNCKIINLMEEEEEEEEEREEEEEKGGRGGGETSQLIPKLGWFTKLLSFQVGIIYNSLATLFSPFLAAFSIASKSYRHAEEAAVSVESVVFNFPSKVTRRSFKLVRKLAFGLLGALHTCMVLVAVLVVAVVLGVGLVQLYVEEPVVLKERLFFDYTQANPRAVFSFGRSGLGFEHLGNADKSQVLGIPVGHRFQVSLALLMPESEYNREVGVFQVTTEILSAGGNVTARSSQPCMLRFRSLPIRLLRTLLMGVPLVLGISEETQRLYVPMLNYREVHPKTKAVRVTLSPRAGTAFLPQFYEAEVLVKSQLPWRKQLVRNWKWTFSVWTSLYTYILLVVVLLSCCRPLIFQSGYNGDRDSVAEDKEESDVSKGEEVSDVVRRWKEMRSRRRRKKQQKPEGAAPGGISREEVSDIARRWKERRRRKREAVLLPDETGDAAASFSASSVSVDKDDASIVVDDNGDSESESVVCSGCW